MHGTPGLLCPRPALYGRPGHPRQPQRAEFAFAYLVLFSSSLNRHRPPGAVAHHTSRRFRVCICVCPLHDRRRFEDNRLYFKDFSHYYCDCTFGEEHCDVDNHFPWLATRNSKRWFTTVCQYVKRAGGDTARVRSCTRVTYPFHCVCVFICWSPMCQGDVTKTIWHKSKYFKRKRFSTPSRWRRVFYSFRIVMFGGTYWRHQTWLKANIFCTNSRSL